MCHHIFPKKCIFIIPDPVKNQHLIRFFLFIKRSVFFIRSVSSSQVIISISLILYMPPCYCSSGHTKCAFPASRPSIRIFCPVQKRLVTVIKYAQSAASSTVIHRFRGVCSIISFHRTLSSITGLFSSVRTPPNQDCCMLHHILRYGEQCSLCKKGPRLCLLHIPEILTRCVHWPILS